MGGGAKELVGEAIGAPALSDNACYEVARQGELVQVRAKKDVAGRGGRDGAERPRRGGFAPSGLTREEVPLYTVK